MKYRNFSYNIKYNRTLYLQRKKRDFMKMQIQQYLTREITNTYKIVFKKKFIY